METLEQLRDRLLARFPAAKVELVTNPGTAAEHSLLLDPVFASEIARFLRNDSALCLDYCSNVSGVDWPEKEVTDTVTKSVPDPAGGPDEVVEEKTKRIQPGYLEAVY
ncbi:MAG: NADH-quinone oxidoreductase subunit, partial [Verrucomicrobiota bacterium]|nr:NADH-quinone oxidoreductase subunit [Verrucomicrobiota bacterium]